jgi:hypothetical protein
VVFWKDVTVNRSRPLQKPRGAGHPAKSAGRTGLPLLDVVKGRASPPARPPLGLSVSFLVSFSLVLKFLKKSEVAKIHVAQRPCDELGF